MTKPKCRDCGCEAVVWGSTKAGAPLLMELRPHFIYCKKRRKKAVGKHSASAALVSVGSEAAADAVRFLTGETTRYKVHEAKEMVARVSAEVLAAGDVAEIVTDALRRLGK